MAKEKRERENKEEYIVILYRYIHIYKGAINLKFSIFFTLIE